MLKVQISVTHGRGLVSPSTASTTSPSRITDNPGRKQAPRALENTLAKIVEKVAALKLTQAAEEHNLLPWTQMGARKQRSTLSALELLTASVQTAWKSRPGCVVSMLSLDLSGAFDNVDHRRLIYILKSKGFPEWMLSFIQSFLTARRTRIAFTGYTSPWIDTQTGIP
jgi:hypothetical protein